jgi:hypothetical protein
MQAPRTLLQERVSRRAIVLNYRIVKVLTLFVVIIPRSALCDPSLVDSIMDRDAGIRKVLEEVDPKDGMDCLSMGELDIVFRTDNNGAPKVGVMLTDPRGRRIGFDPLTQRAWQEFPEAQGYVDCDDLHGSDACRGIVQVCGPISGTYKLEMIAQETTTYSVSISARSKELVDVGRVHSSRSEAGLNHLTIRARSRDVVLLNYSRDPRDKVTAQLQHPLHAQWSDARFHARGDVQATKSR